MWSSPGSAAMQPEGKSHAPVQGTQSTRRRRNPYVFIVDKIFETAANYDVELLEIYLHTLWSMVDLFARRSAMVPKSPFLPSHWIFDSNAFWTRLLEEAVSDRLSVNVLSLIVQEHRNRVLDGKETFSYWVSSGRDRAPGVTLSLGQGIIEAAVSHENPMIVAVLAHEILEEERLRDTERKSAGSSRSSSSTSIRGFVNMLEHALKTKLRTQSERDRFVDGLVDIMLAAEGDVAIDTGDMTLEIQTLSELAQNKPRKAYRSGNVDTPATTSPETLPYDPSANTSLRFIGSTEAPTAPPDADSVSYASATTQLSPLVPGDDGGGSDYYDLIDTTDDEHENKVEPALHLSRTRLFNGPNRVIAHLMDQPQASRNTTSRDRNGGEGGGGHSRENKRHINNVVSRTSLSAFPGNRSDAGTAASRALPSMSLGDQMRQFFAPNAASSPVSSELLFGQHESQNLP